MKINCEFSVSDRILPSFNIKGKHKPIHAQISIGCKPTSASLPKEGAFLMVCTAKNRAGTKYPLRDNVAQIFSRFCDEGKLTISLKFPEHDLILCKCDPLELKCFLNILKHAASGQELRKEHMSTLVPASTKAVTKPTTKMKVTAKKDYPLTSNFPKTLEMLTVHNCNLKRFDTRIVNLKALSYLDLSQNVIQELPVEVSSVPLRTLILTQNRITTIADGVFAPPLSRRLQMLELSQNSLRTLPHTITNVHSLTRLGLNANQLCYLPYGLASITNLNSLSAASNKLDSLPADFMSARFQDLDLFGNPFLTECVSLIVNLKLPTLVELAARSIKVNRVRYRDDDIPRTLIFYLSQGRRCFCGSWCFQSYARCCTLLDLRRIAGTVVKLDSSGRTGVPVQLFVCSTRCLKRYQNNPLTFWRK